MLFSRFLFYLIILPLSYLPFSILYIFSDFLFFILYYIVPYRKRVVFTNLQNSFPEKSEEEIKKIAKKFYSHFCDFILESVKTFSISESEMRKRMKFVNPEIFEPFYKKKKSIIAVTGHYANWEWEAVASQLFIRHKSFGIYLPLKNKFFDKKVQQSRTTFGMTLISVREMRSYFDRYMQAPTLTGMIVDQTPSNGAKNHWTKFLNQDTAVFLGTERFAVIYDYPVFYGRAKKIKRGYYELEFVLISEHPRQEREFNITEQHTKLLEQQIIEEPAYWLWTHKRWKNKKNPKFTSGTKKAEGVYQLERE